MTAEKSLKFDYALQGIYAQGMYTLAWNFKGETKYFLLLFHTLSHDDDDEWIWSWMSLV